MLISNDHRHPKNVNGNFRIIGDCINLWSPSAELPRISKSTILTTDWVVNIVFFETLATKKSVKGDYPLVRCAEIKGKNKGERASDGRIYFLETLLSFLQPLAIIFSRVSFFATLEIGNKLCHCDP